MDPPDPPPPDADGGQFRRWLVVAALATAAVAGGGYFFEMGESPEDAWREVTTATAAGDYGAVWDRLDPVCQGRLGPKVQAFAAKAAPDRAAGMTDRERFALLLAKRAGDRAPFLPGPVAGVTRHGDRAVVRLGRPDPQRPGREQVVSLVRVNRRWRLTDWPDLPD